MCLNSLSVRPISEKKFHHSDNFSDLFFWLKNLVGIHTIPISIVFHGRVYCKKLTILRVRACKSKIMPTFLVCSWVIKTFFFSLRRHVLPLNFLKDFFLADIVNQASSLLRNLIRKNAKNTVTCWNSYMMLFALKV